MKINLEQEDLKSALVGLVIAVVEILQEVLEHQAIRRVDGGHLDQAQIERLGKALLNLKQTIAELKEEHGVGQTVASVRSQLDGLVQGLFTPERTVEKS